MTSNAKLHEINAPILQVLGDILERGRALKLFRDDVIAIDVHLMISALCFFRMANRFTVKAAFHYDMAANSERSRNEGFICDAVLGFLSPDNLGRPRMP